MAVGKMGKVCQCLTIMTNKYILQTSQYIFVLQLCFLSAKLVIMQYQCQCILLIVSAAYISTAKTQHLDNSFLSNNLLSVVKHNTKHYFELHNRSRLSQNLYYCEEILYETLTFNSSSSCLCSVLTRFSSSNTT